jgi:uncharacterized RDD family membrane protein YckC
MQMFWLAKNGVQQGPMPLAQAQKLIDDGQYQSHHMAWIVGTPTWSTIAEIPELSTGFRPPGTPLGADHPGATAVPPPPPPAAKVPFTGHMHPHSRGPRPWRRYAARTLDTAILTYVLEAIFDSHLPFGGLGSSVLLALPSALLLIPIEMLCLQRFQTTIGKYFFGIMVRSENGAALTQAQSLERAMRVAVFGNAMGLFLLHFIANFIAYLDIRRPESASWDRTTRCVVLYEDATVVRQIAGSVLLVWLECSGALSSLSHLFPF